MYLTSTVYSEWKADFFTFSHKQWGTYRESIVKKSDVDRMVNIRFEVPKAQKSGLSVCTFS